MAVFVGVRAVYKRMFQNGFENLPLPVLVGRRQRSRSCSLNIPNISPNDSDNHDD